MAFQNRATLSQSMLHPPTRALGPKNTNRVNGIYYESTYFLSMQFAAEAQSMLEVGCAADPFAEHLHWIRTKHCVAPFVASYMGRSHDGAAVQDAGNYSTGRTVRHITADFMTWPMQPRTYDLIICNQVLEHIPTPGSFLKKLISGSRLTTIISVPFMWRQCCGHLHHYINVTTILEWSKPHQPVSYSVVAEKLGKRLIAVFAQS
jgi:hypothetical protein